MILTAAATAADALFYVGTYTRGGKSDGIYSGKLDTATGKLGPLVLATKAADPGFLALSRDGKYLYSTLESTGKAGAFRVEPEGLLTPLNEKSSGGGGPTHVSLDSTGHHLFVANYGGGSVAAFPIDSDGSLGERSAFIQLTGSGPNPKRQDKPHAHSIYPDLSGRFVYSCDLGTDHVWIFRFDPAKGTLVENDPPSGKVPPGGGPRHFALHPNGKFAYANNEMGVSVTAFARDTATGALSELQTIRELADGVPTDGVTSAEIFCHPSGKWLYVSNRGHDSLTVFGIREDGKLTWLQDAPSEVKAPRGFGIDPSGRWLIAGGQGDDRLAVFEIDPATGKLRANGQFAAVGTPVCVVFAPVKL